MRSKMWALVASTATAAVLLTPVASASAGGGPSAGRISADSPMSAQGGPTIRELLDKCKNGADYCTFHPSGSPNVYRGDYRLAGGATNCSWDKITRWVEWSASEHTTNSIGVEMSAEGGIGEVFKVSFKASYGREWGWSSTKTDKVQAEVSPRRAINVFSAPMKQTVRGTYELHFGYKYYGHYYWYVRNVEVTGPADDSWDTRVEGANANC